MKIIKYSLKLDALTVRNHWRNRPKIDLNIAGVMRYSTQ